MTKAKISETPDLWFAVYCDASRRFQFLGCVAGYGTTVLFRFRDPLNELPQVFEEYKIGAASAPAIEMMHSMRKLRRALDGNMTTNENEPTTKETTSREFTAS